MDFSILKSVRRASVILTEKSAKNFIIFNKMLTKNGTVLKNNNYEDLK